MYLYKIVGKNINGVKLLEKTWREGCTYLLLVRRQNGIAFLEDSGVVSHEAKHAGAIRSCNLIRGHLLGGS